MDDYLEIGTSTIQEDVPSTLGKMKTRTVMYELFGISSSDEECLEKQVKDLIRNKIKKREEKNEGTAEIIGAGTRYKKKIGK